MSSPDTDSTDPDVIEIDPNGDLILDITSESSTKHLLKVSSNTLCLASPVFRAMFGPASPFQEGKALQEKTTGSAIRSGLHDDHYNSLLIIMNVIHLRIRQIPTMMADDALYQLAVVCDKYEIAEVLLPWVAMWAYERGNIAQKPGYEKWYTIAWVFGLEKTFFEVTKQLVTKGNLDKSGQLVTGGVVVAIDVIPQSVTKSILETREKILSSLDQVALNEMEKYRAQRLLGTHVCKAVETTGPKNSVTVPQKKAHCDTVAVGAIMRSMFLAGMWPPQQTTQSRTVTKTAHGLTMIEDFGNEIPEPGYMNTKVLHTNCGPQADLKRGVSGVLAGVKGLKLSDIRPKGTVLIPEKCK